MTPLFTQIFKEASTLNPWQHPKYNTEVHEALSGWKIKDALEEYYLEDKIEGIQDRLVAVQNAAKKLKTILTQYTTYPHYSEDLVNLLDENKIAELKAESHHLKDVKNAVKFLETFLKHVQIYDYFLRMSESEQGINHRDEIY